MDYIRIVDLSPLEKECRQNPADWKGIANQLFSALNGMGFVYLKNHGIQSKTISEAFEESLKFYHLPDEVKERSLKDITKSYNGYAKPGQVSLQEDESYEYRESYDYCGNLRYNPPEPKGFGPALEALENGSKTLVKNLLRLLALSLEIEDEEFFVNKHENLDDLNIESFTTLSTIYYPPTWEKKNVRPGVVRCADHSDYGTLTLLWQDDIGGLEVKKVNGDWISAKPIPDTILMNTGDLLEFWSGGLFPATHHRVLLPEAELKQKASRQSIVYFVHPDDEVMIQPIKNSKNARTLKDYDPIPAKDHAKMRLDKSYNF